MGQTFTVADGYAFYTLRSWKRAVRPELPSPALQPYFARILARPAVIAALDAERDS
jgi:glutathione S-transferase